MSDTDPKYKNSYIPYFGLQRKPFSVVAEPDFAYPTKAHQMAMLRVSDCVVQRQGLALLRGEMGVGKSTVATALLREWQKDSQYVATYIEAEPGWRTASQFTAKLLGAFDLPPHRFALQNQAELANFLIDNYTKHKITVVIVDEAQKLSNEAMSIIHTLNNLSGGDDKLLQIVLFGQLNIDSKMSAYYPALYSRIARRGSIDPLLPSDTVQMIHHRMRIAGSDAATVFPDPDIFNIIQNATRGNPRLICITCDHALSFAWGKYQKHVTKEDVCAAIQEENIEFQAAGLNNHKTQSAIERRSKPKASPKPAKSSKKPQAQDKEE